MKTERCHASKLLALLETRPIATLPELKAALGTQVDVTVFRKLRALSYRTSYSHSGRYYTLERRARFDRRGLWAYEAVGFSRWGTLVRTVEALVHQSAAGYRAAELESVLSVGVNAPLLKLVRGKRIARQKLAGVYLYCSAGEKKTAGLGPPGPGGDSGLGTWPAARGTPARRAAGRRRPVC